MVGTRVRVKDAAGELLASAMKDPDFVYAQAFAKDGKELAVEGAAQRVARVA